MKSTKNRELKIMRNKKGVFGLTSVQAFFAIILAIALLSYVIVVILGTLQSTSILPYSLNTTVNESGTLTSTPYTLSGVSVAGFSSLSITQIVNTTNGAVIPAANYTNTAGVLTNATATSYGAVKISYTYNYYSPSQVNTNVILQNVSTGVSTFFSNITPVYAILAILVIILVLVVLVRIVSGGQGGGRIEQQL